MIAQYLAGDTVAIWFNSGKGDGTPITLAGTPAVLIQKDTGTTTDDSGISLTVDAGTVTGLHLVAIDTSQDGTFFTNGHLYLVRLSAGTVDSISVVGKIVGQFWLGYHKADALQWNSGSLPTIPGEAPSASTIAGAVLDEVKGAHAGHIASIPTNPYTGTPPSAADVADAVLNEAAVGHTGVIATNLDAAVSTRSSHSAADVWAVVTRSLTDKAGFSLSTAGILAIWHQLVADIVTASTIGKLIKDNLDAAVSTASAPTVEQIDTQLSTTHGSGDWDDTGTGSTVYTDTVTTSDGTPIEDAQVEIYNNSGYTGDPVITDDTDVNGVFSVRLNAGTYYCLAIKSGYVFTAWSKVVS